MKNHKLTVLVLEDEPSLRNAITQKLEGEGITALSAASVEGALGVLKEHAGPVHAVWLDHYLQGSKTGVDFVREFRTHKEYKQVPVIVVSNSTSNDRVLEYINLGVHEHIGKADTSLKDIIEIIKTNCRI